MLNRTIKHVIILMILVIAALYVVPANAGVRNNRNCALTSIVQVNVETRFGTSRRCSGFMFSTNGYIVTSYHAISDAENITVYNADLGVFEVDSIRRIDPRSDIAILSIDKELKGDVVVSRLGDSRGVKPGDLIHVLHHSAYQDVCEYRTTISELGYPRQFDPCYLTETYASELLLFEFMAPCDVGSAGGIICNDSYEVIGLILGAGEETPEGRKTYAISASYLSPLLISTYEVNWSNIHTDYQSDAEYFDKFFGPAPQKLDFYAEMPEGYLMWYSPIQHVQYNDYEFTLEINDKIDKTWFYTSNLVIDGRPLREWSASRVFIWSAETNPWDLQDTLEQYVHFDADSLFSKRVYKKRDTEEWIMTRHILAFPLEPGEHSIQYENVGANYKSTGTKRKRISIATAQIESIDITGLSLVSMILLPNGKPGVGEGEPVHYDFERYPLQDKEINAGIRSARYPLSKD